MGRCQATVIAIFSSGSPRARRDNCVGVKRTRRVKVRTGDEDCDLTMPELDLHASRFHRDYNAIVIRREIWRPESSKTKLTNLVRRVYTPHDLEDRCALEVGWSEMGVIGHICATAKRLDRQDRMSDQGERMCNQTRADESRRTLSMRRGNRA